MKIIKEIQNISSKMEANRIGRDYINIIDTLKLDKNIHETAHSRVLQELLRLGKQYDYPLLKLFFATVGLTHLQKIKVQSFSCEKYNIDIFIEGKIDEKKYGIIIENKINYACDQDNQIKRYIEIAKDQYGCDANDIYVLYLTRHHNHHLPQEYSISPEDRKKLEAHNQFKLISYEKEILHFLSNILDTWNNDSIRSAVYQYRDHIRALVNTNPNEKELKVMDRDALYNSLGYSIGKQGNTEQFIHFLHQMKEIEAVTYEAIHDEIMHEIKRSCDGQVTVEDNESRIIISFKNSDISLKLRFIFEGNCAGYALCQQNNILVDHNNKPIPQDLDNKIKFFFDNLRFKKSNWSNDTNHAFCYTDLQNATDNLIEYQNTLKHAIEWLSLCENLGKEHYHSFINEDNNFAVVLPYHDGTGQNSLTLFFGKQEKRFWYGMYNAGESEILADKNKEPIDKKRNNTIKAELKSFAEEQGCTFDAINSKQWFSFWCPNQSTAFEEFIDFIEKTKSVLPN